MSIEWDVDAETGLVVIDAVGQVQAQAYLALWDELIAEPGVGSGPRILADFRQVEVTQTGGGVRTVAAGAKRFNDFISGGRLAVVATQEVSFGLARMYEALVEARQLEVRVFRDYDEARTWALDGAATA